MCDITLRLFFKEKYTKRLNPKSYNGSHNQFTNNIVVGLDVDVLTAIKRLVDGSGGQPNFVPYGVSVIIKCKL